MQESLLLQHRLPRIVLACLVACSLTAAGATYQGGVKIPWLPLIFWDRGYGSISGGEPKEVYTSQLVLEYQPQGVEQSQQAIESRNVFHGFGAAGWIQVEF